MKRILVPTDFTALGHSTIEYAISLAKEIKAEVIIFHSDEHDPSDVKKLKAEVDKSTAKDSEVKVSYNSSHRHFSSITVNALVKSLSIDLIVMSTHGEKAPLEKKLFGRDTNEIAENSECALLVIPQGYTYSPIKNLAYSSDLNFLDKEIGAVIQLAKSLHAGIDLFHVTPVFPDLGDTEKIDMNKKLQNIKDKFHFTGIRYSVEKTKHDNEILKGITSFIDHHKTDALVMFNNHLSVFDEFISTTNTEKIIEHIKKPVFIFQKA
ncbi:MAG: universal stress protein [Bacteroidia bacterium]